MKNLNQVLTWTPLTCSGSWWYRKYIEEINRGNYFSTEVYFLSNLPVFKIIIILFTVQSSGLCQFFFIYEKKIVQKSSNIVMNGLQCSPPQSLSKICVKANKTFVTLQHRYNIGICVCVCVWGINVCEADSFWFHFLYLVM